MQHRPPVYWPGLVFLAVTACTALPSARLPEAGPTTATAPAVTATAFEWFPPTFTPSPEAVASRQPTPDMRPGVGTLILTDDFSSMQEWNVAVSDRAAVAITEGGLTVAAQPGTAPIIAFRKDVVLDDVFAEVTARISLCRGADAYGLLFRGINNVAYYRFVLACNGTSSADRISVGSPRVLQPPTPSGDVPVGAPGTVRLGVWARGSEFHFFVNGRYQFTTSDKSYSAGGIGVFARAGGDTPVTVTFSDLAVYDVSSNVPAETPTP